MVDDFEKNVLAIDVRVVSVLEDVVDSLLVVSVLVVQSFLKGLRQLLDSSLVGHHPLYHSLILLSISRAVLLLVVLIECLPVFESFHQVLEVNHEELLLVLDDLDFEAVALEVVKQQQLFYLLPDDFSIVNVCSWCKLVEASQVERKLGGAVKLHCLVAEEGILNCNDKRSD